MTVPQGPFLETTVFLTTYPYNTDYEFHTDNDGFVYFMTLFVEHVENLSNSKFANKIETYNDLVI